MENDSAEEANCSTCGDDGWYAFPSWAEPGKTISIRKVRCPNGCPLKDPEEPGIEETAAVH